MPQYDIQTLFEEILRAELDGVERDEMGDYITKWGEHKDGRLEIEDATLEEILDDWLELMEVGHADLIRAIKNGLDYEELRGIITEEFETWWNEVEEPRLEKKRQAEEADDESDDALPAESDSE